MTEKKPVTELASTLQMIESAEPVVEKELVVFDLDGTLVANEEIRYGETGYFTTKSHRALIREVRKQEKRKMVTVIFMTGREEQFRAVTAKWLKKRQLGHIELYLRKRGVPGSYVGRYKGQKIAKLVRLGNYTSVRMYEDNKGFLTSVRNTLKPAGIPLTKLLCVKGKCQEIE